MKTYPYHTPEGIIQLVEKLECDKLQDQLYRICKEGFGNDDTIGLEPADDYVLRKLDELRSANAELLDRLAEARESHLAASARDVQTIQRQAILLERLAAALKEIAWIKETGQRDYSLTGDIAFTALSAYESANVEPVANSVDEAVQRMEAVPYEEMNGGKYVTLGVADGLDRIRTRLISAAKGEQP